MTLRSNEVHNKQLAERFFKGITDADRDGMLSLASPDLVWVVPQSAVPPYGGTHRGAAHIVDMMLSSVSQTFLPGTVHHRVLMSLAEGDTVVVETNMQARQGNGREYNNFYVFIFECKDGLITQIREHVDTAYAVQFFSSP